MPTPTYKPLANATLSSAVATLTFASIPATYRDLVLVVNNASTTSDIRMQINNDSTTNYSFTFIRGESAGANSSTGTLGSFAVTGNGGFGTIELMDYSATDKHKTGLRVRNARAVQDLVDLGALRWGSTAAITTLQFFLTTGNLAAGSTFTLYGIVS
jgi:hypothetical protein